MRYLAFGTSGLAESSLKDYSTKSKSGVGLPSLPGLSHSIHPARPEFL